jgi:hypothetical protein
MTIQLSTPVRDAMNDQIETTIGASAVLRLRTGAMPANPAAADAGTIVAEMALPADWASASSGGTKSLLGTWQDASANNTGTIAHFRLYNSAGSTCHIQGTCGQAVPLTTSALTAANGNVLTFAATTGVVVGMNVAGTGIVAGTTVVAVTGTTVTLSQTSTAGVSSGAAITFTYDMTIDNATVNAGQQVSVTAFTYTAPNA